MNRIASAFCIAFLIALLPCALFAQWKELPGPSAGAVNDICAIAGTNGAEMYAATPNGVYRTTDSAKTWTLVGLKGHNVRKITQYTSTSFETIFAIVSDSSGLKWEVCRSGDSGQNWDTDFIRRPNGIVPGIAAILGVLQDGNDLVLAVSGLANDSGAGIFRSTDVGITWEHQALSPTFIQGLSGFTVGGGSIFGMTLDTLWSLPSHGSFWEPTDYPGWHRPKTVEYVGNNLFVGAAGRVDISTDNGTTWLNPSNVGLDTLNDIISTLAVDGLTIFATSNAGLFKSTNGASSWEAVQGVGGYPELYYGNAIRFSDNRFLVAGDAGVFTSLDGINWNYASNGITGGAQELASNGSILFVNTIIGIFRSTDHGQTWLAPGGRSDLQDSDAIKFQSIKNDVFAMHSALWRWDSTRWDVLLDQPVLSVSEDTSALFAALGSNGIKVSFDDGITWTNANNGLPIDSGGVVSLFAANGAVLAFTGRGSVYASSNEGVSWDWMSTNHFFDGSPVVAGAQKVYVANVGKIFSSSDLGITWDSIPLPSIYNTELFGLWSFDDAIVFSRLDGVYVDDGSLIRIFGDSTHFHNVEEFAYDDSLVYIAGYFGNIYAEPIASLPLAVSSEPNQIEGIALHIFPNPATTSGTFSFTLPKREHVSLQLFDELGVNHGTYFDGVAGPGETQVPFKVGQLAAGTYIAVLRTPEGLAAARIILR